MSDTLHHRFTSAVADSADPTLIQPSNWNDGHVFSGGSAGNMLVRDPTDATYGAKWVPGSVAIVTISTTGVVNDYALGANGTLRCSNASLLTLTGVQAGLDGQLLRITALVSQVDLPHNDTRSLAANRFANQGSSTVSVRPGGSATYQYAGTIWRLVSATGTNLAVDGPLTFGQDGAYDIGSAGAASGGRPRDIYAAGSLIFPTTPNPSSTATAFDDYREVAWTPALSGSTGSPTYSLQVGEYVKGARLTILAFQISLSNVGTLAGTSLTIALPFAIGTLSGATGYEHPLYFHALATNWISLYLSVSGSSNIGTIYGMKAAGTSSFASSLAVADLTNGTILRGVLVYPSAT